MRLPALAIAAAFTYGIVLGLHPALREVLTPSFFFPLFSFS